MAGEARSSEHGVERGDVLERLTAGLHAQIPMTAFLQIGLVEFEPDRIVLGAPLEPSRNHRGTAFGPGVFTAAGLAPWLLLVRRAWAARLSVQILLRRCDFAIHRPIAGAFGARCDALLALDAEALRRGERVRLSARAHVVIDDQAPAATYTGHYTLVPGAPGTPGEGDLRLPFPEEWRR
jgi:thioesterase domain-containing protein